MLEKVTLLIEEPSTDSTAIAECAVFCTRQFTNVTFVNGPVLAVPNFKPFDDDAVTVQLLTVQSFTPLFGLPLFMQMESSPELIVQFRINTCQQSTTSQPSRFAPRFTLSFIFWMSRL